MEGRMETTSNYTVLHAGHFAGAILRGQKSMSRTRSLKNLGSRDGAGMAQ